MVEASYQPYLAGKSSIASIHSRYRTFKRLAQQKDFHLKVLAALADEYSDGILHVTTRQDFQLHYVHIEDTPDLMRRLATGLATRR